MRVRACACGRGLGCCKMNNLDKDLQVGESVGGWRESGGVWGLELEYRGRGGGRKGCRSFK